MISRIELTRIAKTKHLTVRNAEKDYLLELLLFALSDDRRSLAFKGGTALYKFYNLNRFSEDLDFDLVGKRFDICLLYTSPSPRDLSTSRMPSSA